jgi:hypothetical protein
VHAASLGLFIAETCDDLRHQGDRVIGADFSGHRALEEAGPTNGRTVHSR